MTDMSRRSALSLALAVTAAATVPASVQAQAPKGISRQSWSKRESMIPGYKSVAMRDQ